MAAIVKEPWEIEIMRDAGRIVADGLEMLEGMVRPGVSTAELDGAFEKFVVSRGAYPTFKGYRGYVASICASVNEEVVHGIPSFDRKLAEGDILSVDAGATYKGYVGDSAVTFPVGKIGERAARLLDVTRGGLEAAILAMGPGVRLSRICRTIQQYAESRGYSVVKKYVGHGIGREMHEDPQVPNYVIDNYEFILKPGIVLALEPMVNEGTDDVRVLKDQWTVVTKDGGWSAHFEHTVAVTPTGRDVLTRRRNEKNG
ncbi:MAG: type I methionyl aminopeptidase [Planctomycetes bacterium]|nr:type I methionyl aminopeptidase [Planctomycetota bacterium]